MIGRITWILTITVSCTRISIIIIITAGIIYIRITVSQENNISGIAVGNITQHPIKTAAHTGFPVGTGGRHHVKVCAGRFERSIVFRPGLIHSCCTSKRNQCKINMSGIGCIVPFNERFDKGRHCRFCIGPFVAVHTSGSVQNDKHVYVTRFRNLNRTAGNIQLDRISSVGILRYILGSGRAGDSRGIITRRSRLCRDIIPNINIASITNNCAGHNRILIFVKGSHISSPTVFSLIKDRTDS